MLIKDMFEKDINRPINGVIQVEQEQAEVIKQEVSEYVITSELKKHFNNFFDSYSESFETPTDNTGVWITGFFGSGKSHFLKMLSYLLENKQIDGKPTVEYFREKYDDELSFMNIVKSTSVPTETILFNIDVEGSMSKDDTAVLKVFAKMFYEHLGFYGKDLKLAKLEQFISKRGKMDDFKRVFEEKNGESWLESREAYAFFEDDVVETLVEVLGMSEDAAHHWFDGTETADISIAQLVDEIKEYVNSKPKGFRFLFMIDEAGQYIGTNTSLLLNLQSLIEKLGSVCRGQVWVVATGQEALDDMIKIRTDEFSRIMARFNVRLSLTSSSVGEVIEKRLLTKKPEAYENLSMVYDNNDSVLSNLYSLQTQKKDLKGYRSCDEFARIFPFVPYQFIIMKDVFNEIRKKGHAGKHQSSGERSMLNGFQESAQKIQERDEFAIVPMYYFYDTLHSFLDTTIRSVIERAERASYNNEGLIEFDVSLLKLLYLIRYIDDIPSNIENLTILMADDIRVDKQVLREEVKKSLDRLINQNYVSRNGDVYMFLTDEEQDIARDIKNTDVDTSTIVSRLGDLIFNDIYKPKKFKYEKYNFPFNAGIDEQVIGSTSTDAMKLHFMTVAADSSELQELKLITNSKDSEAIIVLSEEYQYFESMEMAEKIRKYVKQINVSQKPTSFQKIIQDKQNEARRLEKQVIEDVKEAIVHGKYYIDGEVVNIQGNDAIKKIDEALKYLVEHTYYNLNMIEENFDTDADISAVLNGTKTYMDGFEPNQQAQDEIQKYLELQYSMKRPTSMFDIQQRYSRKPYGWRESDIAGVVAQILVNQKATIKYAGQTIKPNDYRMVSYLRTKSEVGQVKISKRVGIDNFKLNQTKSFLREYFDVMDLPNDEDGLIVYIITNFKEKQSELKEYYDRNKTRHYPGYSKIKEGLDLVNRVLQSQNDNAALIDSIVDLQDDLLDNKDDMRAVEEFYETQINLFESADKVLAQTQKEMDYYEGNEKVEKAAKLIKDIVHYSDNYNYSRIPQLNEAIATIKDAKSVLLSSKKTELYQLIDQCFEEVETKSKEDYEKLSDLLNRARISFDNKKQEVGQLNDLITLEAKKQSIFNDKDKIISMMENALKPVSTTSSQPSQGTKSGRKVREYYRQVIFPTKNIKTEEDIDNYLRELKAKLMNLINDGDEIKLK